MKDRIKIAIAIAVLLSGIVLVPVMGLPAQGFTWQRFAGVYTPAALSINHDSGKPGSFFTITGINFTAGALVTVSANGVELGTVDVLDAGELDFMIETTGADTGFYLIEVSGTESALTQFTLDESAPIWPPEGSGKVLLLPPGIAVHRALMPLINR